MDFFPWGVGLTSLFCWALLSKSRVAKLNESRAAFEAARGAHRDSGCQDCAPPCPFVPAAVRHFTDLILSAATLAADLPALDCTCTTLQESEKAESVKAAAAALLGECTKELQCLQATAAAAFCKIQAQVSPFIGFHKPQLKLVETEGSLRFLFTSVLLPNDLVLLGAPSGTSESAPSPSTGPIPATPLLPLS